MLSNDVAIWMYCNQWRKTDSSQCAFRWFVWNTLSGFCHKL